MGAQDTDLVWRLRMLHKDSRSYKKVKNTHHSQAIPNDNLVKVSCCNPVYGGLRWGRMDKVNQRLFKIRRDAGEVRRNIHTEIGFFAKRIRLQ